MNCVIIGERLAPAEPPCENKGWPELGGLCRNHFIKFDLTRALTYSINAENHWRELHDRLVDVERQMGLRAIPYTKGGKEAAETIQRTRRTREAGHTSERITSERTVVRDDDMEGME